MPVKIRITARKNDHIRFIKIPTEVRLQKQVYIQERVIKKEVATVWPINEARHMQRI